MSNSHIRYQLKNGDSIFITIDRYLKMTDADFHNLDSGNVNAYTRCPIITADMQDYSITLQDEEEFIPDDEIFIKDEEIFLDLDEDF